ncbi:MAG: hypothetical protein GY711_33640 [bacterium]|nr:hypothetical protein [bacterium]
MTPLGLEKATSKPVALARAAHIARATPGAWIWDATCGIGADSVALSESGLRVAASDLDGEAVACARANLAARPAGAGAVVARADALRSPFRVPYVLLDPDRRTGGKRSLDPDRWSPSWSHTLEIAARYRGACVKLAPSFDPQSVCPPEHHGWQWFSRRRELSEVCLWLGDWCDAEPGMRSATLVAEDGTTTSYERRPRSCAALSSGKLAHARWLAEPDPSVIRAGLLGNLASEEGYAPLAPRIAFLAGREPTRSPFLRCWPILGTCALDPRKVRALLREHDVGPLTVKKRGHPDSADLLARRLRGRGSRPGILAVTRLERGHLALLLGPQHPVKPQLGHS